MNDTSSKTKILFFNSEYYIFIYLYTYILYHCQQLCYYLNNNHTYAGFKIIFELLAWISLGFCQGSFFSPLSIINKQSAHVLLFFSRNLFLFIKKFICLWCTYSILILACVSKKLLKHFLAALLPDMKCSP